MFNQFCIVARAGVTDANILHKQEVCKKVKKKILAIYQKDFFW
jgi:hypothetical protein